MVLFEIRQTADLQPGVEAELVRERVRIIILVREGSIDASTAEAVSKLLSALAELHADKFDALAVAS